MIRIYPSLLLFLLLLGRLGPGAVARGGPASDQARADRAVQVLQQWYEPEKGLWKTTSWWNSANALNAIIDYTQRSGSQEYLPVIANTFDRCKEFEVYSAKLGTNRLVRNFLNPWYDDEGWWVLVWIDAYDLTGQDRYLEMARTIFADMTKGWDEVCGGGVYWQKPKIGKHTISNGLFLQAAARLHQRGAGSAGGRTYLEWALATWKWLQSRHLISASHLVENGLSDACELQPGSYYTYNQGVVLGGLLELATITGDPALVAEAESIARATMQKLVHPGGVLKEAAEPQLSGDATQFKGIFMRNLARLYARTADPDVAAFIRRNADSVWTSARDQRTDHLGAVWNGPFDQADAARQSSALDALNAALSLGEQREPTAGGRGAHAESTRVRVMTWEVGQGLAGTSDRREAVLRAVRSVHPDILALPGLADCDEARLADAATHWGHPHSALFRHEGAAVGLTSRRPIVVLERLGRGRGHAVMHGRAFGLDVFVCELSPTDIAARRSEADEIVFRVRRCDRAGDRSLVLGGMRALSPFDAELYAGAAESIPDYSVVSTLLSGPLVDLHARFVPSASRRVSVPSMGQRLDYVLATPRLAATGLRCGVMAGKRHRSAAGHQAVFADFDLGPSR